MEEEQEKDYNVPTVDPDAPLEIEQIKGPHESATIPTMDKNAPLKMDMDSPYKTYDQDPPDSERKGKKLFILGTFVTILIVLAVGGFFFFQSNGSTPSPSPTSTAEPTPTETPKPALDRTEWSLEVLNGSGVSGLAKKVGDKIKDLGYPVIKTGNADKDSYEVTQILVKAELKDKVDLVIADLKDVVKIASVAGELKDSTASARIILGKDQ